MNSSDLTGSTQKETTQNSQICWIVCCMLHPFMLCLPQPPIRTRAASAAEVSSMHHVPACTWGQHAVTACPCDSSSASATPLCPALILWQNSSVLAGMLCWGWQQILIFASRWLEKVADWQESSVKSQFALVKLFHRHSDVFYWRSTPPHPVSVMVASLKNESVAKGFFRLPLEYSQGGWAVSHPKSMWQIVHKNYIAFKQWGFPFPMEI